VISIRSSMYMNMQARCSPLWWRTRWNPIKSAHRLSLYWGPCSVVVSLPWIQWAVTAINSDVPAPAWSQKPGQAKPKKAGPSRAWFLAWDGFWPSLWFWKAVAGGLEALKLNFWYCTVGKKNSFVIVHHFIFHCLNTAPMSAWVPEHDKRQPKASAKVTDAVNISKPGLKSHQAARDLVITESEATRTSTTSKNISTDTRPAPTTTSSQSISAKRKQSASVYDVEDESSHAVPKGIHQFLSFCSCLWLFFPSSSSKEIPCCAIRWWSRGGYAHWYDILGSPLQIQIQFWCITAKPTASSKAAPSAEEQSSSEDTEPEAPAISLKDRTKDVDAFFHPLEKVSGKPQRACILCKYIWNFWLLAC